MLPEIRRLGTPEPGGNLNPDKHSYLPETFAFSLGSKEMQGQHSEISEIEITC